MSKSISPIPISPEQRRTLEAWIRAHNTPQSIVRRAKTAILAADGLSNVRIAIEVGVSRPTVILWRKRFLRRLDREFPKGTPLHLIVDNYGTHKQPRVKAWLEKHPRFTLHFTPTSSSWLNLVERWFRDLTEKRVRRGSFESTAALIAAIEEYLAASNADPKPFVWHKSAQTILAKLARCKAIYETLD